MFKQPAFLWYGLLLITFCSVCLGAVVWKSWPDSYVHLVFCDVGQGDATLISYRFTQVLIDAGVDNKVKNCLEENMPFWDRTLELVVATHADADHIGGIDDVLDAYKVNKFWLTNQVKTTNEFVSFRSKITSEVQRESMRVETPFLGHQARLNPYTALTVVSPQVEGAEVSSVDHFRKLFSPDFPEAQLLDVLKKQLGDEERYNDGSIVFLLTIKNIKVLLTADLEMVGEEALQSTGMTTDIDILKVGHHGSKTSSTPAFLEQIRPENSIISCGQNNRYGHPHQSILENLEAIGSVTWRTDQQGEVEVISDGEKYWIETQRSQSDT
ncbi:MAG TPA: MBL fold metallo-hydrolase [Vitreimonas sp.]|nr:MBL fold metallo-hydrolase [Vitreimonas sp.]